MAPRRPSYLLEPEDIVIMRPLLPVVMVSNMAPVPGPADLSIASVYPRGARLSPKSDRHSRRIRMLALPLAPVTVLEILAVRELSRPLALATPLATAMSSPVLAFASSELLVHVLVATYTDFNIAVIIMVTV